MSHHPSELPTPLAKILTPERWDQWSPAQQAYIVANHNHAIDTVEEAQQNLSQTHGYYTAKTWQLGAARLDSQEICPRCEFAYCFYAQPRNWSMSATADVWNLMKCANVDCQHWFESCL